MSSETQRAVSQIARETVTGTTETWEEKKKKKKMETREKVMAGAMKEGWQMNPESATQGQMRQREGKGRKWRHTQGQKRKTATQIEQNTRGLVRLVL